jgi:hypothetical protein
VTLRSAAFGTAFFALGLVPILLAADPINPVGFPKKGDPGGGVGAYRIWFEGGAWHLRTSTENSIGKKDKLLVFTGSVKCESKLTVEGKRLEKKGKTGDTITPHADGRGFDFQFKTYGATDEAVFKPAEGAKTLTFKLQIDGEKAATIRIIIGENGEHPDKNEFKLPAHPKKEK